MINYEKWFWIELIGFDNSQKDLGVKNFLKHVGFIPDGLSLLLWNPDFIHAHCGLQENGLLGESLCSYGARPCNENRMRQAWTKYQLQKLIYELKKRNIKVYFSVFDQIMSDASRKRWNIPKRTEWIYEHEELFYISKHAEIIPSICPLKRLKDGTFYEDFFIEQLQCVMEDYAFDGFHGADGYAHPRLPVYIGDFSDDMVTQFMGKTNIKVPDGTVPQKATWILKYAGQQWRDFHAQRQQQFWSKIIFMLHSINRKLIFNTAWTRDPFEAKYRYGIDYRLLADIGIDKFVVEAPAAVVELEGWNKTSCNTLDKFMTMIMRLKAYVPDCKLILLNCIKDGMEQYNVLRHAPTMLESDIYSMTGVLKTNYKKELEHCLAGIMACLADGISISEWEMIYRVWNLGFSIFPATTVGTKIVWSERAFQREWIDYDHKKICSSYRMQYQLLSAGAAINQIIDIMDVNEKNEDILVVLHPYFFPLDELHKLSKYRGQIIFVGLNNEKDITCSTYEDDVYKVLLYIDKFKAPLKLEPQSWLDDLPEAVPIEDFFFKTARIINNKSNAPEILTHVHELRCWCVNYERLSCRLWVRNDKSNYLTAQINMKRFVKKVSIVTQYPCLPVTIQHLKQQSTIEFKIPPCSTVILDIIYSN